MTNPIEEIQAQTQRVHAAYENWENSDPLFENARWLEYQAALARLDAMLTAAKREAVTA